MQGLIKILFSAQKCEALKRLYDSCDAEDQTLIRSTIAEQLKDTPYLIPDNGTDWLLCSLMSMKQSPSETVRVFQALAKFLYSNENQEFTFLKRTENGLAYRRPTDIADSCLFLVGVFPEYLEQKTNRSGAPSIGWYSKLGALNFSIIGYENISKHFKQWTQFIHEELAWNMNLGPIVNGLKCG